MEILYVLIVLSLIMAVLGLLAFIWATQDGQFSDLKRPAEQMLLDELRQKQRVESPSREAKPHAPVRRKKV